MDDHDPCDVMSSRCSVWRYAVLPCPPLSAPVLDRYRFFGVEKPEFGIMRAAFIRALRVHLIQEYKQNHIHPKVFSDVIERTLDVNVDGIVTEEEWRNFVYRFGPLSDCFEKAKSACIL